MTSGEKETVCDNARVWCSSQDSDDVETPQHENKKCWSDFSPRPLCQIMHTWCVSQVILWSSSDKVAGLTGEIEKQCVEFAFSVYSYALESRNLSAVLCLFSQQQKRRPQEDKLGSLVWCHVANDAHRHNQSRVCSVNSRPKRPLTGLFECFSTISEIQAPGCISIFHWFLLQSLVSTKSPSVFCGNCFCCFEIMHRTML